MRHLLALSVAGLIGLAPAGGLSQGWPNRPVRVVIPFAAGSVSEAIFRTMSPGVEADLGQRFVVESKPGADGAIGTGEVVRASPDGYTLLLGPTAVYAVTPHLFRNLGYDPLTALDPISLLADAPLLAVVGANVPANTLQELARYVRASPGKFNFGSPGSGSPAHLTGAAFSQQTGNSLVYVPYKGTPPMVQALLAGDIQVAFPTYTGIIGPVKAGKLRILAVMSRTRMPELPGV
ncbi:MAG TPA: tripartite tricarboxylate transporter substrate binding protein, partial [Burkholderiales bacterium]|nr:tripartite tricarboxylate transporter substrate binding protein [Burkholderiales bacterium]